MTSCSASPGARPRVLARRGFARVCAFDDNLLKAVITPRTAGMDTSRRPVNVVVITDVVITDEPAILDQPLSRDRPLVVEQRFRRCGNDLGFGQFERWGVISERRRRGGTFRPR
jgi:hypothetical protein